MPHTYGNPRVGRTAAVLLMLPAALGLAACGGSSKGSSATTNASATTTNGKGSGRFGARATALRTCLQKEGIALPERPSAPGGPGGPGGPYRGQPGQRVPFVGGFAQKLPKGVSRAKFDAALRKCGGDFFRNGRGFNSAQARQRFAKFAECMRRNGVKLPAPDTSGKGPIFNTKGIDTSSAAFRSADMKCVKELRPRAIGPNEGVPAPGSGPAVPGPAGEGPPPGA